MTDAIVEIRELSAEAFAALGAPDMVYVRKVSPRDLNDVQGAEELPDDAVLYAVHAANGARMAVLDDRDMAFHTARQHDMTPVNVH